MYRIVEEKQCQTLVCGYVLHCTVDVSWNADTNKKLTVTNSYPHGNNLIPIYISVLVFTDFIIIKSLFYIK